MKAKVFDRQHNAISHSWMTDCIDILSLANMASFYKDS